MNKKQSNPLLCATKDKTLAAKLEEYLSFCKATTAQSSKKAESLLPNQAGFCRFLGCGIRAFEQFKEKEPSIADWLCAVFEDEALNADRSPTLLNAYLKRRLGYTDSKQEEGENGSVRIVFEHDVMEDGE